MDGEGVPPIGETKDASGEGAAGASPLAAPAHGHKVRHRLNLALQGGGTHGAYTWGVLARLLEDERLEVHAVSGTSAGAVNGAVLAQGLARGGRQGGIDALGRFWRDMGQRLAFSPLQNTPVERLIWGYDLSFSLAWQSFETLTRVLSPYQLDPFDMAKNPLREAIEENVDLAELRTCHGAPHLFVTATNVRTGKPRVFRRREVTTEALLASACLPHLFKAVEIDGEAYWDGGYMGNPALWPLYDSGGPPDIVLVQINPLTRTEVPRTPSDIMTRLNEISFNASLIYEMRGIEFVQRLVDNGTLKPPRYRRLFVHIIEDEAHMRNYGMSTKYNGAWDFLLTLHENGRAAADAWLAAHHEALGRRDTVDIRARFL